MNIDTVGTGDDHDGLSVEFVQTYPHCHLHAAELAGKPAKEAADHNPNTRTNPEPQPEPGSLRTLMATTEFTTRQRMRDEWERSCWEAEHGRELFRLGVRAGKGTLTTYTGTHRAISSVII